MAGTEFFFGAMSPYSWFAAERIGALIEDVTWRPVFAGGLFRSVGRESWGLGDRRAAGLADCEARAAQHGLGSIRWPDGWPTSDVLIARAMVAADEQGALPRFALAAMRAQFHEGARLDDPATVSAIADTTGLDGPRLLQQAGDDPVKQALRERTDAAVAAGVTGLPTVLHAGDRWWGDDRLDEAADAIRAAGT
jgi:2-hydroxychromene-2-carboxylate isomerase